MAEVHDERRGPIAVLTLDNPPVNALSVPTLAGLVARIERQDRDGPAALIMHFGHGASLALAQSALAAAGRA